MFKKKFINKIILIFEILIVFLFIINIIIPDWGKIPLVKDYFGLLIIGEFGVDIYLRLKEKTKEM